MKRQDVYKLIDGERKYQDKKWNEEIDKNCDNHSVEDWIVYMEDYLSEAKHLVCRSHEVVNAYYRAMGIIRKVTAMGVCAMEQRDTPPRT